MTENQIPELNEIKNINIFYVYVYYDPRTTPPTPIYVGKGKGKRIYDHLTKKTNFILKRKIQHIKELNLHPVVEKIKENLTNEDACKLEKELISKYGKICEETGTLCNFTDGGEGSLGYKHRSETLQILSNQRKGKKQTQAQYNSNCSRIITDEHKQKISIANKGIRRLTPDQYKQIAEKNRGIRRSDETRKLLSSQRKGKKQTPAQYAANCNRIPKTKKVKCLNNNVIYNSAKEAALLLNLKYNSIISAANGARHSIKGYRFAYIDTITDNHPSFC